MMRAGNTYRGAKKREAKARGLNWKEMDKLNTGSRDKTGTVQVIYPFHRMGKKI